MLWSFSQQVMDHHDITLPMSWFGKIMLAPAFLANNNISVFNTAVVALLIFIFFFKRHYITTSIFFWLALNLYVVYLPFANGADMLLFILAFWCIPMATHPKFKSDTGSVIQKAAYNSGTFLCQLQIVIIYFVSGWDKLVTRSWQSGQAFDYVVHLNTMFNPAFNGMFENPTIQFILSWMTIIFELAFVILVWWEQTRIPILITGLFFHLFIWIVVSLPDFASTMMVSYILFLKDADLKYLKSFFSRQQTSLQQ
jgi:hypothetical protein